MTFKTNDDARKMLTGIGFPTGALGIWLHFIPERRDEQPLALNATVQTPQPATEEEPLAPPQMHVEVKTYEPTTVVLSGLSAGGSTSSSGDFPVGRGTDGSDVVMQWYEKQERDHWAVVAATNAVRNNPTLWTSSSGDLTTALEDGSV
jgi:hypothetical protein